MTAYRGSNLESYIKRVNILEKENEELRRQLDRYNKAPKPKKTVLPKISLSTSNPIEKRNSIKILAIVGSLLISFSGTIAAFFMPASTAFALIFLTFMAATMLAGPLLL